MTRAGGNPNLKFAGQPTQFPAVSPGERTKQIAVRLPESMAAQLKSLPGQQADHVRAALRKYLDHLACQPVEEDSLTEEEQGYEAHS